MARERQLLRTSSAFEDTASYSRAVRVGNRILVSATAALAEDGTALHEGAYEQAAAAIAKALDAVRELGGAPSDVVRTRLFLAAGTEWEGPVRAHGAAFAGINPANTTLYVHGFIPPGVLVEVELEAEL
jgi:enamine deaminase RidA (YjgF/YER057c/UK114 family)